MINCDNACPYPNYWSSCAKCQQEQLKFAEARIKEMAKELQYLDYCPRKFGFTDKTSTGNCPIQKGHGLYPGECEQCWDYSLEGGYDD